MALARRKPRVRTLTLSATIDVVAIDSNYEEVTRQGFDYREKNVYPYLESKGFTVVRRQGKMARRVYTTEACTKPGTDYITGIGHGLDDAYTGDWGDIIFKVGSYDAAEVAGKVIHFVSCQTAAKLGPDFIKKGCLAFFGYDINFSFSKELADLFFECDSEIDRAFADGLSAGDVHDRVMKVFERNITALKATGKSGDSYWAAVLATNMDHLRSPSIDTMFGSKSARLG
ncbi:MAG TPA: hypothetical protein VHD56_11220 [Tepidisphaeraceae bacterium]|nr:hypothetical protein [Tepidisphaeraceae bacterium]